MLQTATRSSATSMANSEIACERDQKASKALRLCLAGMDEDKAITLTRFAVCCNPMACRICSTDSKG